MTDPLFTLPLAVLPDGVDPEAFYDTFAGRLKAGADGDTVSVWVAADEDLARVYAPVKAAMRFAPSGTVIGTTELDVDTLVLQTWPLSYADLRPVLGSTVPSQILIGNVDQTGVRDAARDLYVGIGRTETSVDLFMAGEGLLLVGVGTPVGSAAAGTEPRDLSVPNNVIFTATDPAGEPVNVTQMFGDGAALAGIDAAIHPLLTAIPLEGWIDVVVLDEIGHPLAAEAYELYLSDGTTRSGTTDSEGRIAETELPHGDWGLDLPGHPSFAFTVADG